MNYKPYVEFLFEIIEAIVFAGYGPASGGYCWAAAEYLSLKLEEAYHA